MSDGECARIVVADSSTGGIGPADKTVAAVGGSGDNGGIVRAGGLGGDIGGAHGVVSGVGCQGVGITLLDIGKVAPSFGCLVIGEAATGDVDVSIRDTICGVKNQIREGWGGSSKRDDFCQITASECFVPNAGN